MNRKFLEQLGLTEEQVEAVMSEHGKSTQDLQAKVSAAEDNAKGLQDQLRERDKDMNSSNKTLRAMLTYNKNTQTWTASTRHNRRNMNNNSRQCS